tara:strand:+ start:51 stop:677 length:627 start_codon:yes stop_codon:yes gene_type:complete
MNKTFTDGLNIKGHLTIHKVANGEEELVFDDKNVIVSGFGWGLSQLYGKAGSTSIADYQIDRFQLGVSGHTGNQVSSTYELSGPLSSVGEYTTNGDSNLYAVSAEMYANNVIKTNPEKSVYARIPFSKVTKVDDRSVRYTIFIDEDSCNSLTRIGTAKSNLNEIGLFLKNPTGYTADDASVLAAYRYFSNITKTTDFGLLFRWTISFG